jgi:hypothetical protein
MAEGQAPIFFCHLQVFVVCAVFSATENPFLSFAGLILIRHKTNRLCYAQLFRFLEFFYCRSRAGGNLKRKSFSIVVLPLMQPALLLTHRIKGSSFSSSRYVFTVISQSHLQGIR